MLNEVHGVPGATSVFNPHHEKLSIPTYSQQVSWRKLLAIPVKQTTMVIITN